MKKTYGVHGLLEWRMLISAGGAYVKIRFSGGSLGPAGVRPAQYSTSNRAIQHIIENSDEFASGKIIKL